MNMPEILAAFTNKPLFTSTEKFLTHLGVKFSTQTKEPIPFLELYEEAATEASATIPKDIKAIFSRVENTYFIGTVTDDTLKGDNAAVDFKTEAEKSEYEGMFVFAVEMMKPGASLKRSEAAVLVRDADATTQLIPTALALLKDEKQLKSLHTNILKLAQKDSAKRIAEEVIALARKKGKRE